MMPLRRRTDIQQPRVRLTAVGKHLVITTFDPREDPEFAPMRDGRIGSVILDTAKNVGVSSEALTLLRKIPRGTDDIGDVDSWELIADIKFGSPDPEGGRWCFGWMGGPDTVKDTSQGLIGSRTWRPDFPHIEIPNDVPVGVMQTIVKEKEN